ncbi:Monocarboxylate transporter 13 [Zancudomyces culisetae]|uniref:Monocarboxylate transporter 13 n=1 Tax=Zancudomyces culisetae TaxID=1213189 RepID=A0A1R1PSW2_ZANCU|nr:Monocarboxylate transporter 13 [Zancudomyces culisetae]|eukprot:OMH84086.1 Monocarboxylate transporter 13 [Zancudomyces culisetae]
MAKDDNVIRDEVPLQTSNDLTANPTPTHSEKEVPEYEPEIEPDTGYAWIILIAGFLNFMLNFGMFQAFGVFQTYFLKTMFLHEKAEKISWIGTAATATSLTFGVFAGPIYNKIGLRYTLLGAGTLTCLGLVISGFVLYPNVACVYVYEQWSVCYDTVLPGQCNRFGLFELTRILYSTDLLCLRYRFSVIYVGGFRSGEPGAFYYSCTDYKYFEYNGTMVSDLTSSTIYGVSTVVNAMYFKPENVGQANGLSYLFYGFGILMGNPLTGLIFDSLGHRTNYHPVMIFSASCFAVSTLFLVLAYFFFRKQKS